MLYYDIHTHKRTNPNETISIVSIDVHNPIEPNVLVCNQDNHLYSIGIHPWSVDANDPETLNRLFDIVRQLALLPQFVAIGEVGLDKSFVKSADDLSRQQEIFLSHTDRKSVV